MRILFDFDDVLNDLSACWIRELNRRYHRNVSYDQLTEYTINSVYPDLTEKQIITPYLDGTLYLDISPVKKAQELIRKLVEKHEVFVATSNILGTDHAALSEYLWEGSNPRCTEFMLKFLWDYYPEIPPENIFITKHKRMLKADVLVDDNPAYLKNAYYKKILIDKPYNRGIDDERHNICRAANWQEVERLIEEECV